MMRDKYNEYVDNLGQVPDFSNKEEDPFWDRPEPVLLGKSYLQLSSLCYTLDNNDECAIFSTDTSVNNQGNNGKVCVGYVPTDANGDGDPPEEYLEFEDPNDLMGKEMYFNVTVDQCKNLPMDLCTNVFVEYKFKHEPENAYRTEVFEGKNPNPVFNHKQLHHVDCFNDYILDYFKNSHVSYDFILFRSVHIFDQVFLTQFYLLV